MTEYRDDGTTPGTPTWIWPVAVDGKSTSAPATAPPPDGTDTKISVW